MGTKNNPGAFDCYENAEPDEPMFVLLARDRRAPGLVEQWATRYIDSFAVVTDEHRAKAQEARDCANAMRAWRDNER